MAATKLPAATQTDPRRVDAKPLNQPGSTAPSTEVPNSEVKEAGWQAPEPTALDRKINRFQVYADRVSLVAYGAALAAEGGAVTLGAAGVVVPPLLPVAGSLAVSAVFLNGVAGAIDLTNAGIDATQAVQAGGDDPNLNENLKQALAPSLTYVKKSATGLFHRYVRGSVEQSTADFAAGYAAQDEALKHIGANPAFAAEFIPGVQRAIGGGSALGLWFPKLGHAVMALEVPDIGVAYDWAKAWVAEASLSKSDVDATFAKAFPNNKAATDFSRAVGDPERFDAAPVKDLMARIAVAEQSLSTLERAEPLGDQAALQTAIARAREWVDELKEEFRTRDPDLNLRVAFSGNPNVDALILATNDLDAAWTMPVPQLEQTIATADEALAQLKSVEFKPEVQKENDQLLRVYLSKADRLRDVLNSRANAFLLLPRSKTPLR